MHSIEWETKSPKQLSNTVLERAFDKALKQSPNIVIGLKRATGHNKTPIEHLEKCFNASRRAKRLLIITKEQKLLDYRK